MTHPIDPSQNFIASYPHPLDAIFTPHSVAVIGAKDDVGSVGRTLLLNLLSSTFSGNIYPINPKRDEVLGKKSYAKIGHVPEIVDLAIIVTPAHTVPALVQECIDASVLGIIIISAGFKEMGPDGAKLEAEISQKIRESNTRIIGPNCLGIMNPKVGLNASFAKGMAQNGNLAFISQSGAMCTSVLDWSLSEHLGFSAFVSIGSMIDVSWADLIRYFGNDRATDSILMYMETIGDPRAFLSAAREIALEKPIIVIKPGRSQEAAQAAASHTGSLTGSDEVFDAALDRVGVLRVNTIAELFNMAESLAKQPRPKGGRLQIITNAGGPAVLATDSAVLHGAKVEPLHDDTIEALNKILPAAWSHSNPIDVLGDASADTYAKTLDIAAKDPHADGVLVILSPQDMTDPVGTAEALRHLAHIDKPVLASWMGGACVKGGIDLLNQSGIPTFEYPDDAAWSFATMWRYSLKLKTLYETPMKTARSVPDDAASAKEIFKLAKEEKRTLLSEFESKKVLESYGIPTVATVVCQSADEAVQQAEKMGYPVVLKLFSHTITHKSDIGGVKLNIETAEAVRLSFNEIQNSVQTSDFQGVTVQKMIKTKGIELIVGASTDPQFGPVLLFGAGGVMVEIFKDHTLGFAPLTQTLARQMMQKTKIYQALQGFRGQKAVSMAKLEELLVNFSVMIANEPRIKECDINPLLASSEGFFALDARVVLHDFSIDDANLPKPALRPYPMQYVERKETRDGEAILVRPICPEDEPELERFHKELSEQSVRQRYFAFKSLDERTAHMRLVHICFNDFDQEIALVLERVENREIIGVGRLSRLPIQTSADLKMIIKDGWHGKGLGSMLIEKLVAIAKQENITTICATVLSENSGMLHLLQKAGFSLSQKADDPHSYLTITL
jgi:acetyltransferase